MSAVQAALNADNEAKKLASLEVPHSALVGKSSRIQKSDSNTASPDTNHWLSDDWESNSERSDVDLISTFKSRKADRNKNLSLTHKNQSQKSAKPPRKLPKQKDSMTHPLSPSLIDFDSDLLKTKQLTDERNIIKNNN